MKQEVKFELIKTLDDIRWSTKNGLDRFYFETDYYCFDVRQSLVKDNIDTKLAEKILLSHYLIYITNRQMDYRHIFKAGAYVLSKIAEDFLKPDSNNNLSKVYHLEKKNKSKNESENESEDTPENKSKNKSENKLYFKVEAPVDRDSNIYKYFKTKELLIDENTVKFSSRFITTDFLCVYKTFETLKTLKNNNVSDKEMTNNGPFADFLCENCENFEKLSQAMYELTYKNIPQISIKKGTTNYDDFIKQANNTDDDKIFNKHQAKRIWCVIRDYMYHPIFKACFKKIIGDKKFEELSDNLDKLELPGDVWNNNKKFAECFWGKDCIKTKTFNSSKFVREQYEKTQTIWNGCIPVHFDITFSFVPQLCMNDECDNFCPFNENDKKEFKQFCHKKEFKQFCHKQEGNICTFVLYATGIKHKCLGESECDILKILTNNQNGN